ncbi:MAG TPA: peptide-methionine (S)-S-oxide reductase MsrA [Stellaceae bacterium]|nr:peptide-methionine (S)-S-oxide reductase MsrA [Stellaceae bacterium]
MRPQNATRPVRLTIIGALFAVAAGTVYWNAGAAAESPHTIPAPAVDEPVGLATSEIAVLAGGCFWGVQGIFQHVDGVTSAVSGYAGGSKNTAEYETVSTGSTGHAESVRITFDPHRISYGRILQIFFSVVHDPTELNRQGPDTGTQYRSAIFPTSPEQARIADTYIAQLDRAHAFAAPIVTKIEPGHTFYPAERYHQNYLALHPSQPYIAINDIPKLEASKRLFPNLYRDTPVLVAAE